MLSFTVLVPTGFAEGAGWGLLAVFTVLPVSLEVIVIFLDLGY